MFNFARRGEEPAPPANATIPSRPAPGQAGRRDLLSQISSFLLDHGLDVNPANLALAQMVFSGSNPDLNRRILDRQRANEPVTQAWLDQLTVDGRASPDNPQARNEDQAPVSARDLLTGLHNRHAFNAVFEAEYRAAAAAGEALSIAFCDIDGFSLINDIHGHDTGNRVIQAVARVLQRISGQNCHVARQGGEEFILLFRGLTPAQARDELDNARENFAHRRLIDRNTRATIGSVSFSGGVCDVFAYRDPRAALDAAEAALAEAKSQGRNRIVSARKPD